VRLLSRISIALAAAGAIAISIGALSSTTIAAPACDSTKELCQTESLFELSSTLAAIKAPAVPTPAWLNPPPVARTPVAVTRTVTYSVETRGTITADFASFKQLANATLNDARGWAALGLRFTEVASGGDFTLVLSEASQLPSFSPGCGVDYSCNAGRYVIINQDRWEGATPSWNEAKGSLRDYRHMVVNHETGHWLGHSHSSCGGPGQLAPVMQQQSIDLQGCKFNPWPLNSELSSSRLGL
jgi:hypothetical protein